MLMQPRIIERLPVGVLIALVAIFLAAVVQLAVVAEHRRRAAYTQGATDAVLWAEHRAGAVADSVFRALVDSVRQATTIPGTRFPAPRFVTFQLEEAACSGT